MFPNKRGGLVKIFVCIKQVPDTDTRIKLKSDASSIDPTGVKWIVSPYDLYAIEEAIKIREANSEVKVFVVTLGPKPRASESLISALAMGADEGILISTDQSPDANQTAKALASVIKSEGGAHLVLTGRCSGDYNQSSVTQMLAEFLDFPHTTVVSKLQFSPENLVIRTDIEGGAKEIVQLKLPAVVSANKGLNSPRYSSLPGIVEAKRNPSRRSNFLPLE